MDHLRLRARLWADLADPVAQDVPRRLVDVVADVVERARELVHVVTVERRHERAVEQRDDLVGEPVAMVLELLDVAAQRVVLGNRSRRRTSRSAIATTFAAASP